MMNRLTNILAASVLLGFLAVPPCGGAEAATIEPPPGDPPALPYSVDDIGNTNAVATYPFLICKGVREDGSYILEPPEDWQLAPPPEPTTMTIRLKFYDRLDTNALYTVEYTCPRSVAFAGWEIVEE